MKITILGAGYVGLVTAACLSEVGHKVYCYDICKNKINSLLQGNIPFHEPNLLNLVVNNVKRKYLYFTHSVAEAVQFGELIFIAVGTPQSKSNSADLSYVFNAAKNIAQFMNNNKIIVIKSTVPVGTNEQVRNILLKELEICKKNFKCEVASNPEFLKEGDAVKDFIRPERIIIGTKSEYVKNYMRKLYAPFNRNHDKIIFMDTEASELTKYAANAMLAMKISFMNEISNISERLGIDIEQVRIGIGSDSRIGYNFIYPGCGYGGSCLPKDLSALIDMSEKIDYEATLLKATQNVNKWQTTKLAEHILTYFKHNLNGRIFSLWGLAFKPGTDDIRDAPSRSLMEWLWSRGAKVQAYDPKALDSISSAYPNQSLLELFYDKNKSLYNADGLIIYTEWQEFRVLDFHELKSALKYPVIFDGRNMFDPILMQQQGFVYYGISRGSSIVKADLVRKTCYKQVVDG